METLTSNPVELRDLLRTLRRYRQPRLARSVLELLITVIPFALFWGLAWAAVSAGHWAGLLFTVPAAAFLVRLFMIQHDCGHGSFFRDRHVNDWVGRVIGVLTLTPYDFWRYTHALHHASSGNLDRPPIGGIGTLTVRQYRALPPLRRLRYRLYRHPLVLFGLGPVYVFLLHQRLPVGFMRAGRMPWLSTMGTNLAIVALVSAMVSLVGAGPFLLVQLPITLLAGLTGIWLFYVQHQFENTVLAQADEWTFRKSALGGSSYYDLPGLLRWFTANIGIHHVHHLASRIPSYRLPEVLEDHPWLRDVNRLALRQSLRSIPLSLWDEDRQRLVAIRPEKRPVADPARGTPAN